MKTPSKIKKIENKAWQLVNLKWKKWNPESPVLYRLMIQWEQECKKYNYIPHYTFSDILA